MQYILRICMICLVLLLGTNSIGQAQPSPAPRVWSMQVVEETSTVDTVAFRVIFSEPVSGVDVSDFATSGGSQYATVTTVTPNNTGKSVLVEVTLREPQGKLALILFDDDSIINASNIPLGGDGPQNGNAISAAVTPSLWTTEPISASEAPEATSHSRALPRSTDRRVGNYSSIAVISPSTLVVSYQDMTDWDLKLAICTDFACSNPRITTIDSTDGTGSYNSLALTTTNIPVISYVTGTDFKLAVCNNMMCANPTISTLADIGWYYSLALTTDNIPVISFYESFSGDLKLAVCHDTTCTSPTISILDSLGSVGFDLSIALGTTNIPVISYYDKTNKDLKLIVCNDTSCSDPDISAIESSSKAGNYSSVALSSTNVPVISYFDEGSASLKLAVCNDTACSVPVISTVDDSSDTGMYPSLALTSANIPVVSYYDYENANLKLAVCNDAACSLPSIGTPDSEGDVGLPSSLALTSADVPVISYRDRTNGNLKMYTSWSTAIDQGQPNSFEKSSPTVGENIVSSGLTISWEASTYAASYEYCYALSIAACTSWTSAGTATSANISGLSTGETYYWQVRATNTSGTMLADSGTYGSFTVLYTPAAFAKTLPTVGQSIASSTTTLSWAASTYATNYEYCIALSTAACTSWTSTSTATTASISGLSHGATYYWQVRASNTSGTTLADSGTYGSFTVSLPPAAFAKSLPTAGQRITAATTTLSWSASTYATSYAYCYALSTSACTSWTSTGASTTANISGLSHGATYYWQVRATNTSGTMLANNGTYGSFTVSLPPASFAKSSPANNATKLSTSVTLAWAASTRATSYEYCFALTTATCTTWKSTGTFRTAAVSGLTKNKAYYWQVRAKNTAGTTLSSSTFWKFTTAP
jgi:hypothetical protein